MEKNFLNITPEGGNGNQEVTINAKANISLEDREEMLRIRSSRCLLMRRAKISW